MKKMNYPNSVLISVCKIIFLFCTMLIVRSSVSGQALTEDFSYTATQAITANGWTAFSGAGTNAITVTTPGLTYTASPASGVGNCVSMITSGEDDSKIFSPTVSSGSIYTSLLINVSAAQSTGDYFFGMCNSGSSYFGRIFVKTSGAGFVIGVSKNGSAATSYDATVRSFGTTYLVVIKYTITGTNTSLTTDDVVSLWINPTLGGTEPTGTIAGVGSGETDINTSAIFDRVALRQGNASNAPTLKVDGIRVGTTWSAVTAASGPIVDGTLTAGEYGTHTDGNNQQTNSATVTYMTWDNNNLYVGVTGAAIAEGYVLYLDKDPQIPVNGGSNSNGTNVGNNYDGENFAALPFRADMVIYAKNGYREYRTANGSNGWSAATTSFGAYADNLYRQRKGIFYPMECYRRYSGVFQLVRISYQ